MEANVICNWNCNGIVWLEIFQYHLTIIKKFNSKKYQVDYSIWHDKIKKNITTVVDNYKVKLANPGIPVFAWKPMVVVIVTVMVLYGWKFFSTI